MMRHQKRNQLIAWGLCMLAIVGATAVIISFLINEQPQGLLDTSRLVDLGGQWVVLSAFAILAALILSHQPHNRIGWLLLLPVLARTIPIESLTASPPETLTIGWWLLLWYSGWAWMPIIFLILLLPLHFPTGQPPTPRWNWVNWLAVGMVALWVSVSAFVESFVYFGSIRNPIGFLPYDLQDRIGNSAFWALGLLLITVGGVVSLIVRYRRAQTAERHQIKWLVYAGGFFVVVYGLVVANGFSGEPIFNEVVVNVLFYLAVLAFVVAIGIAILRYRLYDIDVIIRKTLVYAVLSGLLALVYFGLVVLLQSLFDSVSGQQSPIVIVISTLIIAALFAPLRQRVQAFIDRRFFRKKYDAQQVLAQFAQTARDETDMAALQAELLRVVQETMQPESVTLWLKDSKWSGQHE
ncbi:MAG: hypothetical protein WBP47_23165 [Candidatus Promineifilaceae bacterium]